MDNQQVKRLSWLAGFYDGEGYLGITINKSKGYDRLAPQIDLVNTDIETIDYAVDILKDFGISVYQWAADYPQHNPKAKPKKQIRIARMKQVRAFTDLLTPFLVTKLPQAILLSEFVNSRAVGYIRISERDYEIYNQLKLLNKKGRLESSETLRRGELARMIKSEHYAKASDSTIA